LDLPEIWPFWSLLDTSTFSGAAFIKWPIVASLFSNPFFPFFSPAKIPPRLVNTPGLRKQLNSLR
jgi:hypothetical protein